MSVLTPRLKLIDAQQAVLDHFELVTLTDIAQGDDADEKKLLLPFLHGRRSSEPVRFKQWRGAGPSGKSSLQQQDKYGLFLLRGVLGSSSLRPIHCYASAVENSSSLFQLYQAWNHSAHVECRHEWDTAE